MRAVLDPALISEVRRFGHFDVDACYNCGSCVLACELAKDSALFPRKLMRYVQLGLKEKVLSSLEPWLCHYCGDCSKTCPRQAEPGESMMTLRRFLTSKYDWTGLASRFYRSHAWELGALGIVAAFMAGLVAIFRGPMLTDRVSVNTFLDPMKVHYFDLILAGGLSFFLLTNLSRMVIPVLKENRRLGVPLSAYISGLGTLALHGATQRWLADCGRNVGRWLKHFLFVSGYVTMFTLVVVFLPWFQTDNIYPIWHPQRWIGYYATTMLLVFSAEILWGRFRRGEQMHRFSEFSDWLFPVLIILTTVTGIAMHAFRYAGWPLATYFTYVAHLMVAVAMLAVEVPFGKWSHLAFRPVAIYLGEIRARHLAAAGGKS